MKEDRSDESIGLEQIKPNREQSTQRDHQLARDMEELLGVLIDQDFQIVFYVPSRISKSKVKMNLKLMKKPLRVKMEKYEKM